MTELAADECEFVLVNRHIDAIAERCITLDNELGGYIATRHLLDAGHRQIAYVAGPMWKKDASDRYAGHQRALSEFGVSENPAAFFEGDFHETSGIAALRHLIGQAVPFTAIVCANDEMAAGALSEAHDLDLHVPAQFSIVGFDNINFAHYTYPKLTTVAYPIGEIGEMAAYWILNHVYQKPSKALQASFKPKLVNRDSTAQTSCHPFA